MHANKLFSWIHIFLSCDFRSHQFSKIAGCRHIITLIILEMILLVQKSHSQPLGMVLKPVVNGVNYPQLVDAGFPNHQQYCEIVLFFSFAMSKPQRSGYFFSHEKWKITRNVSGNDHIGDTPIFHWSMSMGGYVSSPQKSCPRCHNLPPHITTFHLSEFRGLFHQRPFKNSGGKGRREANKKNDTSNQSHKNIQKQQSWVIIFIFFIISNICHKQINIYEKRFHQLLQVATTNTATYLFDGHTFQHGMNGHESYTFAIPINHEKGGQNMSKLWHEWILNSMNNSIRYSLYELRFKPQSEYWFASP